MPSKKYSYNTRYVLQNRPTYFLDKKDRRYESYVKFKERHGFSPDETWNLDDVLIEFLLPRLRFFRVHSCGYPVRVKSEEQWHRILDEIIWSFEQNANGGALPSFKRLEKLGMSIEEYRKRFNRGMRLFSKYWGSLWW